MIFSAFYFFRIRNFLEKSFKNLEVEKNSMKKLFELQLLCKPVIKNSNLNEVI